MFAAYHTTSLLLCPPPARTANYRGASSDINVKGLFILSDGRARSDRAKDRYRSVLSRCLRKIERLLCFVAPVAAVAPDAEYEQALSSLELILTSLSLRCCKMRTEETDALVAQL